MSKAWGFLKDRFLVGNRFGVSRSLGLACFAFSILSFAAIAHSLSEKATLFHLDLAINASLIKAANPWLGAAFGVITSLGSIYLVVLVAVMVGFILFMRKNWWRLLALFLAVGVGQAVLNILKGVFQRPRPKTEMFVFGSSFPSGHVFSATVIYGFCIYLTFRFIDNQAARWITSALLVLLILLIGFSRIYLGVHWFSDTLAGYASGFAWLLLSIYLAKIVSNRETE